MRLVLERAPHVAPSPAAVVRRFAPAESVTDQPQKGRRITFHDADVRRVARAERPDIRDVRLEPCVIDIVDERQVLRPIDTAHVTRDSAPRRPPVVAPVVRITRVDNPGDQRKLTANRGTRIVLIRDRVDAQLLLRGRERFGRQLVTAVAQGAVQRVGSAPDRDPQGTRIVAFHRRNDETRTG